MYVRLQRKVKLSYPSWLYKIIENIFIKEDVDTVVNNMEINMAARPDGFIIKMLKVSKRRFNFFKKRLIW